MTTYRTVRSLLLERDPEKLEAGRPPITSMRDIDFRHQRHAMVNGYNSLTDMAIDELILLLRELQDRVDVLERQMVTLTGQDTFATAPSGWPARAEIDETAEDK